ncbi:hypothetical protein C8R44DRAFT_876943 [Mycena epipterygia]|nr:hypothetical protein C8R44DRAFT_876943 [Mycena epipterygia]
MSKQRVLILGQPAKRRVHTTCLTQRTRVFLRNFLFPLWIPSILTLISTRPGQDVEALVRPSSAEKPQVKNLTGLGVKIHVVDISGPLDELRVVSVSDGNRCVYQCDRHDGAASADDITRLLCWYGRRIGLIAQGSRADTRNDLGSPSTLTTITKRTETSPARAFSSSGHESNTSMPSPSLVLSPSSTHPGSVSDVESGFTSKYPQRLLSVLRATSSASTRMLKSLPSKRSARPSDDTNLEVRSLSQFQIVRMHFADILP